MTRKYRVAGHLFEIVMDNDCPLWEEMGNYSPFEVLEADSDPVFSLTLECGLTPGERTPLMVDVEDDPGMPKINLYDEGDSMWIEMSPLATLPVCGFLRLSKDFSEGRFSFTGAGKFCLDNALMLCFAFRTSCLGTLEMHSSVVSVDGRAYMFLGKSGAGKSTHSRMWLQNIPGTELMNDDNPIVRILKNGEVWVYGSPWSGKTPCYKNVSAPVGGLVSIVQAPQNRIRKMNPIEAYVILSASVSGFRADAKMADGLFETMEKLISSVGFYELECLPDAGAAELCHKEMSN